MSDRAHKAREKHEFFRFMDSVKKELAAEYERITKRSLEDPGTAGDEAEENWAALFRDWLPPNYPIVTKGRLVNENGVTSPQVDVLVLHPTYPQRLRDKKLYFAGGVVAAFECKLTLRKGDLPKVFSNAAQIKRLLEPARETPFDDLHHQPIFGLLAHASALGRDPMGTLLDLIRDNETSYAEHPREMLDIICVANLGTMVLHKSVHVKPHIDSSAKEMLRDVGAKEGISTIYLARTEEGLSKFPDLDLRGETFGALIHSLFRHIAYRDSSLRPLSGYLKNVGVWGGIGRPVIWELGVLPKNLVSRIRANGHMEEPWGKWCQYWDML